MPGFWSPKMPSQRSCICATTRNNTANKPRCALVCSICVKGIRPCIGCAAEAHLWLREAPSLTSQGSICPRPPPAAPRPGHPVMPSTIGMPVNAASDSVLVGSGHAEEREGVQWPRATRDRLSQEQENPQSERAPAVLDPPHRPGLGGRPSDGKRSRRQDGASRDDQQVGRVFKTSIQLHHTALTACLS